MKAILLTAYGDVDKLELRDVPNPTPGPGEIKVRMAGASINPIDWKLRSGALKAFAPLNFPAILGKDASGEVVEVGTGSAASRSARAHRAEAAKLGADGVVALDDDADIAGLPRLDAIADTVGGDTLKRLLGKVKSGGTVGSVVGEPQGAKERGLIARGMLAHSDARRLAELARAVAAGELIIPIARRFPLAEARAAQAFAEKGPGGKVILTG
jgi:NADPH:quinone reductase-like Zn-dependent oxidoreductase